MILLDRHGHPISVVIPSMIGMLHDVDTSTTPPVDGDTLVWVDADKKWKPGRELYCAAVYAVAGQATFAGDAGYTFVPGLLVGEGWQGVLPINAIQRTVTVVTVNAAQIASFGTYQITASVVIGDPTTNDDCFASGVVTMTGSPADVALTIDGGHHGSTFTYVSGLGYKRAAAPGPVIGFCDFQIVRTA